MAEQATKLVAAALRQFVQVAEEIKQELGVRRVGERAAEHQPEPAEKKAGHSGNVMESAEEGDSNAHEYTRIFSGDKTKVSRRSLPAMPRRPGKRDRSQVLDLESIQEKMAGYRAKPIAEDLPKTFSSHRAFLWDKILHSPIGAATKGAAAGLKKATGVMSKVGGWVGAAAGEAVGGPGGAAVGKTVGEIAGPALFGLPGLALAFGNAMFAVQGFSKSMWKGNEALAAFSPQMAILTSRMQAQEIRNAIELGTRTSEGATFSANSLMRLNNDMQDLRTAASNISNLVGGSVSTLADAVLALHGIKEAVWLTANVTTAMLKVANWLRGQGDNANTELVSWSDYHPQVGNANSGGNIHGHPGGAGMHGPWQNPWNGGNQQGMNAVPGFGQTAPHARPQQPKTAQQMGPPAGKNALDAFQRRGNNAARGQKPEGNEAENLFHPQTLGPSE